MAKERRKKDEEILTDEEIEKRVQLPKGSEMIGVVESRLGYGRMNVICSDGKARICRVPGKFRRRVWIRESDVVIVKPWPIQGDKKGDIIHKYRPIEVEWLKRKGYLEGLEDFLV